MRGAFGGLEIWCVDLARSGPALRDVERDAPRLSTADRDYARERKDDRVASERLVTRMALRLLIERAAGPRWRGVPFARHQHGKPFLQDARVAFSVSHVAGLALIGMAAQGTVGVDVERMRTVHMREPRRQQIEAAADALGTSGRLPPTGEPRFLQAWVRLEALAKAEGCGIGRLLTRLGIAGQRKEASADFEPEAVLGAAGVSVLGDLNLGEGLYAAAAAGPGAEAPQALWLPETANELEALVG